MRQIGPYPELLFFSQLAGSGSLSAAARVMNVTTAAVSKRLTQMERRLGVALLTRTTRRMHLTSEGELYLAQARRILADIETLERTVSGASQSPRGLLRIHASLGFGRRYVAPLLLRFMQHYPDIELSLSLSVDPPPLSEDACDVSIRFGSPPDARVVARRLAANRRLLCASPAYLERRGEPLDPAALAGHDCILLTQGGEAYGVWRLTTGAGAHRRSSTVKVGGRLATNDGEVAVQWALAGQGILMRAQWSIADYLADGRLRQVLPGYLTPDADIYAIYPKQHRASARIRLFVDFLRRELAGRGERHTIDATLV